MAENTVLYQWLTENDELDTRSKINKIREMLGGNSPSYTLLECIISNHKVEIHVNIADYEDEENPEEVTYAVEVDEHHEENFDNIKVAFIYYQKRVNELSLSLTTEQKEGAKEVFKKVKQLEKKWGSEQNRTLKDIESCYRDPYILSVWESEGKYIEETGEGWNTFEDFLISFIEQNIQFD